MFKQFFVNGYAPPEHAHTYNQFINGSSLKVEYRDNMQCADLEILCKLRLKSLRNPLFGYLDIISLRNKIIDLRKIKGRLQLDYFRSVKVS